MIFNVTQLILADGPSSGGGQQSTAPWWTSAMPMLLVLVIFYVALIRPQQRKAKQHASLVSALKSGDKVVLTGGIIGTIITVKEKSLSVRSADAKFEVLKSSVTEITERSSEATS